MVDESRTQRRAAVLGSPIGHSLSPRLHRAAYAGLRLNWRYDAIDVQSGNLADFLDSLDPTWMGLSLTMPLKEEAFTLGDRLVDVTPLASSVTSINTLITDGAGGWRGDNTDVSGIVRSLHEAGFGDGPGTAIVVGSGATARSAIAACARMGLHRIRVMARRLPAADQLGPLIEEQGLEALDPILLPMDDEDRPDDAWRERVNDARLWCSTLPADAAQPLARTLSTITLEQAPSLLDASYHPWPTPLAHAWPNAVIANGRGMLLWQAVEQVRLMTGQEAPVDMMREALISA